MLEKDTNNPNIKTRKQFMLSYYPRLCYKKFQKRSGPKMNSTCFLEKPRFEKFEQPHC